PDASADAVFDEAVRPLDVPSLLHSVLAPAAPGTPPRAPASGSLAIVTAGRREGDRTFAEYADLVQSVDWAALYEDFQGQRFFAWLREQLLPASDDGGRPAERGPADIVLIDSRTGVTEMGGVCTRELADVVVTFCAPNLQ